MASDLLPDAMGESALAAAAVAVAATSPPTTPTASSSSTSSSSSSSTTLQNAHVSTTWSEPTLQDDTRPIHRVASEQLMPRPSELSRNVPVRMPSTSMGKVTSRRRQRNPRRFVVTELPADQDGFLSERSSPRSQKTTPRARVNDHDTTYSETATTTSSTTTVSVSDDMVVATANVGLPTPPIANKPTFRPSKTEVRGRFTIIDLSPDSPDQAQRLDDPPHVSEPVELPRRVPGTSGSMLRRARPQAPRRLSRSEKASTSASEHSAGETHGTHHDGHHPACHHASHHSSQPHHIPQQPSPLRVDLSGLDRHLVFLQQESNDMKALLESMISSNARWISALASSSSSETNNVNSGKHPKAVHPATSSSFSPTRSNGNSPYATTNGHHQMMATVPQEPTLEEEHDKLLKKYAELEEKCNALQRENTQLQHNNIMLDTRLRQEMSVNEELRAHVDQLTQYTESLILGAESSSPALGHNNKDRKRLDESVSSTASTDLDPMPPRSRKKSLPRQDRTVSDMSVDSSVWMGDSNQSGLDDDDDGDDDSDELDSNKLKLRGFRARRLRNASRSTSIGMEDDTASSVYSNSFRDSWVSLFDHQQTSQSEWRSHSYDAGESAEDDGGLFGKPEASNNQVDDEEVHLPRRKMSTMMIVEDLEDPAEQPLKQ